MPVVIVRRGEAGSKGSMHIEPAIVITAPHQELPKTNRARTGTAWGLMFKEMREDAGLSQRQLASIAEVNRTVLRRIEKGKSAGSIDVLERIALSLGYEWDLLRIETRH